MRFGKISAILLGIAATTITAYLVFTFVGGWRHGPPTSLEWLLVIFCMPASLIVGIIGTIRDSRKKLAFITTILTVVLTLLCIGLFAWIVEGIASHPV